MDKPGIVITGASGRMGQMLVRICKDDGIGLVNIVRSQDQVRLLRDLGAVHVVDSSSDSFRADLEQAVDHSLGQVRALLECYGIDIVDYRVVTDVDQAVMAADEVMNRIFTLTSVKPGSDF